MSDMLSLTSVGATSGVPETVASFSGGGFSNYFPTPSYQAKQVGEYIAALDSSYTGLFNASGRGYPDVAAYGLGYVVVGGVTLPAGGTSMSSPVFGAVVGLLNDALITVVRARWVAYWTHELIF
jgi:tripeptidyl-peptidase-1